MIYFKNYNFLDYSNIKNYIKMYLSNIRNNISVQKNKSKISYSGKKPWKQKGTGNARSGKKSSPIWRGGARAFANTGKENYKKKINKKFYKYCYKNSFCFFLGKKIFFINFNFSKKYSTKEFYNNMKYYNLLNKNTVFVGNYKKKFYFSGRNIKFYDFVKKDILNPYFLIFKNKILIDYNYFFYYKKYFK
ncbi:50S ribosomal protein L4 [Candidatus Vidania fulgoroideorum]